MASGWPGKGHESTVEKVGAELTVTTNWAPEASNSPAYGVFGAQSGVKAGIERLFQQAEPFQALQ